jgi:hypothetical protein
MMELIEQLSAATAVDHERSEGGEWDDTKSEKAIIPFPFQKRPMDGRFWSTSYLVAMWSRKRRVFSTMRWVDRLLL